MRKLVTLSIVIILAFSSCTNSNKGTISNSPLPSATDEADASQQPTVTEEVTEEDRKAESFTISKESFPRIDGNYATLPLSYAVYETLTGASHEEAEINITHCRPLESIPYSRLFNNEVDIILATEPEERLLESSKDNKASFTMKPIAYDALIFLTNQANPVHELSDQQIIDIYSGKMSNWLEVGGDNSEIIPFQSPFGSGSQNMMKYHVMKGMEMIPAPHFQVGYFDGGWYKVADYDNQKNSIGYSSYYYETFMSRHTEKQLLKINGVEPNQQTIKDKTYPFITTYYAMIRADEPTDSLTYQLFEWLTSKKAQKLIGSYGYNPVNSDIEASEVIPEPFDILNASTLLDYTNNESKRFSFDDNKRLLFPLGGMTLLAMDNKANITSYLQNARQWSSLDSYSILVDAKEPFYLSGYNNEYRRKGEVVDHNWSYYGAYNLLSNSFIVPYQDEMVNVTKQFIEIGNTIYDRNGNIVLEMKDHGYVSWILGNTVIVNDVAGVTYYDENVLKLMGVQRHLLSAGNDYLIRQEDWTLLNYNGEIILDAKTFEKKNKCKVENKQDLFQYANKEKEAIIVHMNDRYYITDFSGKIIESISEDDTYIDNDVFYKYTETGCLIERVISGDRLEIAFSNEQPYRVNGYGVSCSVNYPYSSFSTDPMDSPLKTEYVYYYENYLTNCNSYYKFSDNCIATYENLANDIVITRIYTNGSLVYTSLPNEKIMYADEQAMLIRRGNVYLLTDYEGNVLFKCYEEIYD